MNQDREKGLQPLDALMEALRLSNTDLVQASSEQLTHKMVVRGRKGRLLTLNVQCKILRAMNSCQDQHKYELHELFNYKGKA